VSQTSLKFAFKGRAALITGGAGGLGSVAARAFADGGARVLIMDTNETAAAQVVAACPGGDVEFVRQDLADLDATAARGAELADKVGIDILVNNAAIYPSKAFADFSPREYEAVQRVNASAAFTLCQAVIPGMMRRRWGRIVNISSITFFGGWANLAPYIISKGALIGLTRAVAREYGSFGITANAVCPGAFPTEAERIQGDPQAYTKYVLDHQSVKRRGSPDDFASAVMFLSSEESGFITGQAINVDGGWFMN
jgi:3-oxoacyl-[acyl-carrier protein] reductase